jgi:vanillate monooxygenase ferredoxin subunit
MAATNSEVWQRAVVVAATAIADEIQRIEIETSLPAKADPGSHIDVMVVAAGQREKRSYSIVDASPDGRYLTISVFRAPASRGGSVFMHTLRPGDTIEITQPLQNFPLRVGAETYVLLAGGIGITAIANMAAALRTLKVDYRLVYAGRSRSAMAYLDELVALHGDRIAVHVDDEGSSLQVADLIAATTADTELYMCGPIRLMDAVRRSWATAGRDVPSLRYETFGNSGWFDPEEFTVTIPRLNVEVAVPPGQSMLEALEAAGVDMMFDCRKGECGLCEVRVLELDGVIDHRDVFYSERQQHAAQKMCCCVSRTVTAPGDTHPARSAQRRARIAIDVS